MITLPASQDHRRDDLPLFWIAIGMAALIVAFGGYAWTRAAVESAPAARPYFYLWAAACGMGTLASAFGGQALRRSASMEMSARERWIPAAIIAAGMALETYSIHHALTASGQFGRAWIDQIPALGISAALPCAAFALFWFDEALKSHAKAMREREDAEALKRAQSPPPPPERTLRPDITEIELAQLTPEAREAMISAASSLMRRGIAARPKVANS